MDQRLLRKLVIFFIAVFAGIIFQPIPNINAIEAAKPAPEAKTSTKVIITVRSVQNAALFSELAIESSDITKALDNGKPERTVGSSFLPDIEVTLIQGDQQDSYRLEPTGNLWNESKMNRLVLTKDVANELIHLAESLRTHHYGDLVPWESAQIMVPRKSKFSVTDLESGLTFQVQRRAGHDHADVQPLTKADTMIMKQIYNDHWSWKRKAILVHNGQDWIAASMNGMPHGGDGIPENGFSGHFCIHFYGSKTHKSDNPDLAHQMMVYRAAGKLSAYFDSASPAVLAKSFIEVMNHQDNDLLTQIAVGLPKEKLELFAEEMLSIRSIREQKQSKSKRISPMNDPVSDESLSMEIKLPIMLEKKGKSPQAVNYLFIFKRESKQSPWRFVDILT